MPAEPSGARNVVLSPGIDKAINLFTEEGWKLAMRRLQTQPYAQKDAMRMQRFVFGNTFDAQLDSSNRLLIPERLREYANLTQEKCEVSLVGVENRLEIWNAAAWKSFEADAGGDFDALAPAWASDSDVGPDALGGQQ